MTNHRCYIVGDGLSSNSRPLRAMTRCGNSSVLSARSHIQWLLLRTSFMYDDYIYGQKELADINREFSEKHAGSIVAEDLNKPSGCPLH